MTSENGLKQIKNLHLFFLHNDDTYWSGRLADELLNDPQFEVYFKENGPIQLFYFNTETMLSKMMEEVVDSYYFEGESTNDLYESVRRHLIKGAVPNPGILLIERDECFVRSMEYLPGYKKTNTIDYLLSWAKSLERPQVKCECIIPRNRK